MKTKNTQAREENLKDSQFLNPWDLSGFLPFLSNKGIISRGQAAHLSNLATKWGGNELSVLVSIDLLTGQKLATHLADYFDLPLISNFLFAEVNLELNEDALNLYYDQLVVPYRQADGKLILICAVPSAELQKWADTFYADETEIAWGIASKTTIIDYLRVQFNDYYIDVATERLFKVNPHDSAKLTLTWKQQLFFTSATLLTILCFYLNFHTSLKVVVLSFNCYYIFTLLFRTLLTALGSFPIADTEVTAADIEKIDPRDLPTYTVLVAIYKEALVLPILMQFLRELNYPRSKLEIKIVLEADDTETLKMAKDLKLENYFEFLIVPAALPKTKPKALNYALPFVNGEFLTIYDAEDRPEPDQLLKAVVVFRRLKKVACVQARLNYFNYYENTLTRLFTIEYSQWFDYFLLGLYRLGIPIPLGGTSNHFRTAVLRELCGWDPYNVTEDADLGLRLEKNHYRVAIVNSTTQEEANVKIGNWIRQRSRWLKGHMQTFLVHMRNPIKLYADIGPVGFFGFIFFVGAPSFIAIMNPVLWVLVVVASYWSIHIKQELLPHYILQITQFNLLFGNVLFIALGAVAVCKRRLWKLLPWSLCLPLYWLLQSVASYKALYQLILKPHFWEKTTHGLSQQTAADRQQAMDIINFNNHSEDKES